ncbi:hypothetical protein ElyMa_005161300 [Elysia marginata]|uniref:Secreted protein n=1 Tax=Elysia marginata TaxID=1093978 RepID=A0AAV4JPC6_9GAST|nr:hypothetical protein ElyMa_005161300 [Elysia marginata]
MNKTSGLAWQTFLQVARWVCSRLSAAAAWRMSSETRSIRRARSIITGRGDDSFESPQEVFDGNEIEQKRGCFARLALIY